MTPRIAKALSVARRAAFYIGGTLLAFILIAITVACVLVWFTGVHR